MSWYKEYSEDHLADGFSIILTLAECEVFSRLKSAASVSPERGTIRMMEDMPYPPGILAKKLRIRKDFLLHTLQKLQENKLITQDQQGIHIANWQEDQESHHDEEEGKKHPAKPPKKGSQLSLSTGEDLEPAAPTLSPQEKKQNRITNAILHEELMAGRKLTPKEREDTAHRTK